MRQKSILRIFVLLLWIVFVVFLWWKYDVVFADDWNNNCKYIDDWKGEPYWDCFSELEEVTVTACTSRKCRCKWILLNTKFPIIWDCIGIEKDGVNATNVFPQMVWWLIKLVTSIILVACFILIIVAGIMRTWDNPAWAKKILKKVAITILLLWFSWLILKLINPTFFW